MKWLTHYFWLGFPGLFGETRICAERRKSVCRAEDRYLSAGCVVIDTSPNASEAPEHMGRGSQRDEAALKGCNCFRYMGEIVRIAFAREGFLKQSSIDTVARRGREAPVVHDLLKPFEAQVNETA